MNSQQQAQFKAMVKKLKHILNFENIGGPKEFNYNRLKRYWQSGQYLHEMSQSKTWKDYPYLMKDLSEASKTSQRLLYQMQSLFRHWTRGLPDKSPAKSLTWSSHVELFKVPEAKNRRFYYQQAIQQGWTQPQIKNAIKRQLHLNPKGLTRATQGELGREKSYLNTFWVDLVRVIDGDTIIFDIDLRFLTRSHQEIRLRGINCPELHDPTGEGKKAKSWVEQELTQAKRIVIVSYKTDKFGRYVADVYYSSVYDEVEDILEFGEFLNEGLLKNNLAERVEY